MQTAAARVFLIVVFLCYSRKRGNVLCSLTQISKLIAAVSVSVGLSHKQRKVKQTASVPPYKDRL